MCLHLTVTFFIYSFLCNKPHKNIIFSASCWFFLSHPPARTSVRCPSYSGFRTSSSCSIGLPPSVGSMHASIDKYRSDKVVRTSFFLCCALLSVGFVRGHHFSVLLFAFSGFMAYPWLLHLRVLSFRLFVPPIHHLRFVYLTALVY